MSEEKQKEFLRMSGNINSNRKILTPPCEPQGKKSERLQLMTWEATEGVLFYKQYLLLTGFLFFILLIYFSRLWHLQLLQGAKYRYQSENNRIRLEDIPAPRGIIFDRNGVPLVENRPAYHLLLIREDVQDMKETIETVAQLCSKNPDDLWKALEASKQVPNFKPIRLLSDLDRDSLALIEAQKVRLPGVLVQVEPRREYKWNGTGAHLIGYLSKITEDDLKGEPYQDYLADESVGKVGVEKAFENYLHGKRGGRQVEVDAIGRRMRLLDEVLPSPGRNIWLTVDIRLQKIAESCLEGLIGSIVALDPRSGAILAMASSPTFDQEQFIRGLKQEEWEALSQDPDHPLLNRALGSAYPPGSTFKPIVALAALQEGVISSDKSLFCPGFYKFGNRKYRCWREIGHGSVNLHQALVQSCDVYFYQVGLKLGVDRIADYARKFGLGEKTDILSDAEHRGIVPSRLWKKRTMGVEWQKGETLSVAIGQGFVLATPLQVTMAFAAIANGGKLWQLHVAERIEGNQSEQSIEIGKKLKWEIPVEPRYFKMVQKGLLGVVDEKRGTAHKIKLDSIPIAGKTGTAQVVRIPEGANRKLMTKLAKEKEKDHAWFVGYAPANDPQIVVGVLVEHGGHGSSVAAPLAQKVLSAYLEKD